MALPPIVSQYGGPKPFTLTNVPTDVNIFNSYFYPNQIGDLAIWLDGKDIRNNGSNNPPNGDIMTYWANKAPTSITVTQPTSSYRPKFNSVTGVDFINNNNNTTINGFETDYSSENLYETVFILLNNTTSAGDYNLLYPNVSDGRQLYLASNTISQTTLTTATLSNTILLNSGTVVTGTTTLISSWSSNDSIRHYINGVVSVSSNKSPYLAGGATYIGTDNYAGYNGFNGSISEIIIYSNVLSDTEREKVESYLYWKWFNFDLSTGNPYKTTRYINYLYPRNVFYSYFYPNQISNLAIWLDGKDILNNGSNNPPNGTAIEIWANKANNSLVVQQPTSAYRPLVNSVSGVDFINTALTINGLTAEYSSQNPNETIFIILNNTTSNKNNFNLLYPDSNDGRQLYLLSNAPTQTTLTTALLSNGNLLTSGTVTINTPTLITTRINSIGIVNHYINGLLTGTSNTVPYTTGGNKTYIGTDKYIGSNGFNGTISEILIYSNALIDTERQKVESYLNWKWNTFRLDNGNPYQINSYSNYAYPNINSNIIPATSNNLYSGLPTLDSNNYPLIKNFIQLPNILKNSKF